MRGDFMFIKIFSETLMIFLITYALIDILYRCCTLIYKQMHHKTHKAVLIACVDDNDDIEHIIRTTAKDSQELECVFAIYIKSETNESNIIISQLLCEYPYMHIIKSSDEINIDRLICDITSR